MHFVNVDGTVLLAWGEYERGFTSNHAEFLGLEMGLELLVDRGW